MSEEIQMREPGVLPEGDAEPCEPAGLIGGEDTAVPDDPHALRQKKRRRNRIIGAAVLAVVVIAVAALQLLGSDAASRRSGASVDEQVVSGVVETGNISKTLNAFGSLASASEEDVSVPGEIRVTSYRVSAGDSVKKGDVIATLDRSSVLAAIADVQDLIDELDAEVEQLKESSENSSVTASAAGTVVKVYAQAGEAVTDVMYEHGALMLVSLDGLYALNVSNTGNLGIGDAVSVTGADGTEVEGRVAAIQKETATVTVPLSGFSYGEKATARDASGAELGSDELYLFSQQKITGYSGTVSSVWVSEGASVSAGDALLSLSDTDYTADEQVLLKRRKKLVEQGNRLTQISKSGYVYAEEDGVISSLNEDVLLEDGEDGQAVEADGEAEEAETEEAASSGSPAAQGATAAVARTANTGTSSATMRIAGVATAPRTSQAGLSLATAKVAQVDAQGASEKAVVTQGDDAPDGGQGGGEGGDQGDPEPSHSDETVTMRADIVWLDSSGSALNEGMPESVTVRISGGDISQEQDASAGTGWEASFTVPKYDDDDNEVSYTISLASEVSGFSASSSASGNTVRIILKAQASDEPSDDPSGDSPSGGSQPSGGDSGSSSAPSAPSDGKASKSSAAPSPGKGEGSSGSAFPSGDSKGSASKPSAGKSSGAATPGKGSLSAGAVSAGGLTAGGLITEENATIEDAEEENPYSYGETVLCAFMPNDTVSVDVAIDELDISSIVVGADAQVTLDALPGQSFEGKISALNPFGQNSGGNTKYTVTVTMDKQSSMLLGMSASVGITLEDHENVLVVPEAALVEQDGKTYVYTSYDEAKDELGGLTEVETGVADGTNAEVTSGLEAGQPFYYRYAGTISYVFE